MGNHLFSATDLMSLLLSLCCSAISFAAVSPSCVSLLCFDFDQIPPLNNSACPNFTLLCLCSHLPPVYFRFFPVFSQPSLHSVLCLITSPAGPQVISYTFLVSFPPHVHNGPFGFAMSVRVPSHCLFLRNTLSVSH